MAGAPLGRDLMNDGAGLVHRALGQRHDPDQAQLGLEVDALAPIREGGRAAGLIGARQVAVVERGELIGRVLIVDDLHDRPLGDLARLLGLAPGTAEDRVHPNDVEEDGAADRQSGGQHHDSDQGEARAVRGPSFHRPLQY